MKRFLIPVILILLLGACAKNKTYSGVEDKLAAADSLYALGKYSRAAVLYDEISFERKSGQTAYALIRLADSYMKINRFADARARLEQVTKSFPQHPELSKVYFNIALCHFEESLPAQYDQTSTIKSIDAFRTFAQKFPSDPKFEEALVYVRKAQYKLIEKKYRNGYIYYKMKDYSSALMYFDEVIGLGNTDDLDRMSLYYSSLLHLAQGNKEAARGSFDLLSAKYPSSKETAKLKRKFK
ncbi:MAG TPA: outer membrane protein assembly factor BamD [Candidatus Cloacimonadota bacterium]|nr:outer membrane protein assembly factor BamD [Candidatus Cloacimonadota bacterium]